MLILADANADDFIEQCCLGNRAALLRSGVTRDWASRRDWVRVDRLGNQQPNLEVLQRRYGQFELTVAQCFKREYSDQPRQSYTLAQFVDVWHQHDQKHQHSVHRSTKIENILPVHISCSSGSVKQETRKEIAEFLFEHAYRSASHPSCTYCGSTSCEWPLYAKDWHFHQCHLEHTTGADAEVYSVCPMLSLDWLNAYSTATELGDDYRFCYLGPRLSWTPLHQDVLASYSWSTNICGRKLWLLFPEDSAADLVDEKNECVFDIILAMTDIASCERRWPNIIRALSKCHWVVQEPGETIFVPSGWYHQVHNIEDCISINHNWSNGFNLQRMWRHIQSEYKRVCCEIDDCRGDDEEFRMLSQRVLKCLSGEDMAGFCRYVCFAVESFIFPHLDEDSSSFSENEGSAVFHNHPKVLRFAVQAAKEVLADFLFDSKIALGVTVAELSCQRERIQRLLAVLESPQVTSLHRIKLSHVYE